MPSLPSSMKAVCFLKALSVVTAAVVCGRAHTLEPRNYSGYLQIGQGNATFTVYSGCSTPACGRASDGYTAAMNQLSFGAPGGQGAGDACGRCFNITGNLDPYSPWYPGPFYSIVVKVTNLCPYQENENWCGQSCSSPLNQFGRQVHFDLCQESGASAAFFPEGRGALSGYYEEISCSEWTGQDGPELWDGACLADESTDLWPSVACGNTGDPPV